MRVPKKTLAAKPGGLSEEEAIDLANEAKRVIEYPKLAGKFRTDPRLLDERAMASAHMVATDLLPEIDVVKADPSNNVYLATALAGGARWVVAGNTRHLTPHDGYAGLRIVEPADFLSELDAQR
jgi:predicted nucleic acid-binding protein